MDKQDKKQALDNIAQKLGSVINQLEGEKLSTEDDRKVNHAIDSIRVDIEILSANCERRDKDISMVSELFKRVEGFFNDRRMLKDIF